MKGITEQHVEDLLKNAILNYCEQSHDEGDENVFDDEGTQVDVDTFENQGIMTRNKGIVLTLEGCEFQITIVRSR